MNYTLSIENEYIPEWDKNRKKPEEEKIIIIWTWPTSIQIQNCVIQTYENGLPAPKVDFSKLLKTNIKEIKNLSLNGNPVKTGAELLNSPFVGLTKEIRQFLQTVGIESEIDKKK